MEIKKFESGYYKTNEKKSSTVIVCIHGYGESSQSFDEIFSSSLSEHYQIIAIDLPGFGLSNDNEQYLTLNDSAQYIQKLIESNFQEKKYIFIAHSMGAVAACLAIKMIGEESCLMFINIEGFLIANNKRYSSKYTEYNDAEAFKRGILNALVGLDSGDSVERFKQAVSQANSKILMSWAKSCYELSGDGDALGKLFRDLGVDKLYVYGERSFDEDSKNFLLENNIASLEFESSGHWVMEEAPGFYDSISKILEEV